MDARDPASSGPAGGRRLRSFQELMQHRIQRVLVVASSYDSFIMAEEGNLQEALLTHFMDLNLSQAPDLVQAGSAAQALRFLEEGAEFDLVISRIDTIDSNAAELTRRMREAGSTVPVIALAYSGHELRDFLSREDTGQLEQVFLWHGDVRLLLAMLLSLEDRQNVAYDSGVAGVPVIIVVEDSVRFYSSFLPTIYSELFRHTQRLLSEDLSSSQRRIRMRARPKVLLCKTYEDAWDYFERYEAEVLGVISDFEFPHDGAPDPRAGLELCARIQATQPDVQIVLQSSKAENEALARELDVSFLLKGSPFLLRDLRRILVERFGFGDFVFRMPDGSEVDRARDLKELVEKLSTVPLESLNFHGERNHFSKWFKARTELDLAANLRPRKVTEFADLEGLRALLLDAIDAHRSEQQRTMIADFDLDRFEPSVSLTRIGKGAIGGKARGVAFANRVLLESGLFRRYPDIQVYVPPSVVLGTEAYDQFLEYEGLRDFGMSSAPDDAILKRFVDAPLPRSAISGLRAFLQRVHYPLAVRSSGLLEDSLAQPFAGVYRTLMVPNNDSEFDARWQQLASAIKRVYASVFSQQAKTYLEMISYRLEEEKMAVMIQQLIGHQYEDHFYPDFAGVARSHNFYPEPGQRAEDGVAAVALGMGMAVVGGDPVLRFCPKDPRHLVSFSSVKDALENSQREFYALDLRRPKRRSGIAGVHRYPLEVAEKDGPLAWLGSTYVPEDNRIVDGVSRAGVRLVTFAEVLKHRAFPLAEILHELLDRCAEGTGAPVEIEFAGNLVTPKRGRGQFAFLQLRPLSLSTEEELVTIGEVDPSEVVCRSSSVLGNGRIDDVCDMVVVDIHAFERHRSHEVAAEVARFDARLRQEGVSYLLIGVGRWGSSDPNLGIPVAWSQISGARAIVEAGFEDFRVAPSQGTHFFQNLTSSNVGYFTVNPDAGEGHLDWDWLLSREALDATDSVRHVRLPAPLLIKMSGRTGDGVILKPSL